MSIENDFESRHVYSIIRAENEMIRILELALEDVAKNIYKYQTKRKMSPEKYGETLRRNENIKRSIAQFRDQLSVDHYAQARKDIEYNWQLSEAKNDKLTRDFLGTTTIPTEFDRVPQEALRNFTTRKINGIRLSDRLWNTSRSAEQLVLDWVGVGISQGKSARRISDELIKMMDNPMTYEYDLGEGKVKFINSSDFLRQPRVKGQYRSPKDAIMRIARNETNYAYRTANSERIQKLDFVVGYRVHLSPSHADHDICNSLSERNYPKSFVFTAWHPNCICFVTSILQTKEEFRNGVSGKDSKNYVYDIPESAKRIALSAKNDVFTAGANRSILNSDWYKSNFNGEGIPYKKFGNQSPVEIYKNKPELAYDASPEGFLTKARKVN